jgi:epidermal growth factor receptor substrate 15
MVWHLRNSSSLLPPARSLEARMSFTPSQYELALATRILAKAGIEELRILTADAALKVFESTKVSHAVLSEILSLADDNNDGIIPENGVAMAVRLLGWAQIGEQVTKELINKREHACNSCIRHM